MRAQPLRLLTLVNYLNYIDRYILAAVLIAIQKDLQLNDLQAGLLATSFMIPYMFTSPVFGWLGDTRRRPTILALGVALWSVASLITGWAQDFSQAAGSRFLLGVGESAFTVISIPYLSAWLQEKEKGRKLALFSTALPVGAALGYVAGGIFLQLWNWRLGFAVLGFPGLILAALIYRLPEPREHSQSPQPPRFKMWQVAKQLFRQPTYRFAVLGYSAYSFVVGGVAHWIPSYMQRQLNLEGGKANTIFGAIAVICGLSGTLAGGYLGDQIARARQWRPARGHIWLAGLSMLASLPAYFVCIGTSSVPVFITSLVVTQFLFFISTSPINVAILANAPEHLGTSAMALAILACHLLGDAISAPLIGWVSDQTGQLKSGLLICLPVILLSGFLWMRAARSESAS